FVDYGNIINHKSVERFIFLGNTSIHGRGRLTSIYELYDMLSNEYDYDIDIIALRNSLSRCTEKGIDFITCITRKEIPDSEKGREGEFLGTFDGGKLPAKEIMSSFPNLENFLLMVMSNLLD
ncbi:MAG: hypothetical protein ACRC5T_06865, partial [Cetobacterium sp.]